MTAQLKSDAAKPATPQAKLGCLLLHGFTSHLDSVTAVVPLLEQMGLPYRLPILRGHNQTYQALEGVSWPDWYADADQALDELKQEATEVIIIALSMGGLIALDLAAKRPDDIKAIALMAPAMRSADPLAPAARVIAHFAKYWPVDAKRAFSDQERAARCQNYPKAPTKTIVSFLDYGKYIENQLSKVTVPILILHSRRDRVIHPKSAEIIYAKVNSNQKELHWFEQTGHEMLLDTEIEAVLAKLQNFIVENCR